MIIIKIKIKMIQQFYMIFNEKLNIYFKYNIL